MINIIIALPLRLSFEDWALSLRFTFKNNTIPLPPDIKDWRSWASQIIRNNKFKNIPLPTEITYPKNEDWQKWAIYFVKTVYNQFI